MASGGIGHRDKNNINDEIRAVGVPGQDCSDLSLIHITSVGETDEIFSSKKLEPQKKCEVFEKPLTYFFLLRAAYHRKSDNEKTDQVTRFPAVLVFNAESVGQPYHAYPFDTGGAFHGAFENIPDPTVFLEDYELEPSLDGAIRWLTWAFGDRESYFDGNLNLNRRNEVPVFNKSIHSALKIAAFASTQYGKADGRSSSIELAYDQPIALKKCCDCVILPDAYIQNANQSNTSYLSMLNDLGISFRSYPWVANERPLFYRDKIVRIVREYLYEKGSLDG